MSSSDSMFVLELSIEELRSFVAFKKFNVVSQFADVFKLMFKDPVLAKAKVTKRKKNAKIRKIEKNNTKDSTRNQISQSIIFSSEVDHLISRMKKFPMELILCKHPNKEDKLGSTHIQWKSSYIEYLNTDCNKQDDPGVSIVESNDVYDEMVSKRMANIKLRMTLRKLKNKTPHCKIFSDTKLISFTHDYHSKLNSAKEAHRIYNLINRSGNLNTMDKHRNTNLNKLQHLAHRDRSKFEQIKADTEIRIKDDWLEVYDKQLNYSTSETKLNKNNCLNVIKTKSCSSVSEELNLFKYIFGDQSILRNRVCCVNYFMVDGGSTNSGAPNNPPQTNPSKKPAKSDIAKKKKKLDRSKESASSSPETDSPISDSSKSIPESNTLAESVSVPKLSEEKAEEEEPKIYKVDIRKCYRTPSDTCIQRRRSLKLIRQTPTCVSKCKNVRCENKSYDLPPKPEEPVLIDLSSAFQPCCNLTQKIEEVVGEIKAKMNFDNYPCYCTCECEFGFKKKTTICKICGGYETPGEDPKIKTLFPCPIFHNLADKGKMLSGTTISSDGKKKEGSSSFDKRPVSAKDVKETPGKTGLKKSTKDDTKSIESGKDSKKCKKKKIKDDRFKFNYGYTAPQIGHSQCALDPDEVRHDMGWMWNAENIPGLPAKPGWRPGAISKRLLHQLNKAKAKKSTNGDIKPIKKVKKRVEEKPTILISKKDGEYRIEMQVKSENNGNNVENSPLIYKIASANNQDKIKKRNRIERRLIREAVDSVWSDPYHPELCEKTCLRAYQQAMGILPFDSNNPECICVYEETQKPKESHHSCSCEDETVSSNCSSLDLDWEIHFSPPIDSYT